MKRVNYIFILLLFLLCFTSKAQLTNVTFTMTPNPCNGMNVATITAIPVGGTGPYTYLWTTLGQTTQTAVGLIQNTYICKVTDFDGTSKTRSFGFLDPPDLIVDISSTSVSCNGGSNGTATVDALGTGTSPYSYMWQPGGETSDMITGKPAGTYSITVTDANGCQVKPADGGPTLTINISQPTLLVPNGSSTNALCNGANNGTATIDPQGSGTPGYTYNWSTGANTSVATGLMPGVYSGTVTDSKACKATYTATISEPAVLTVSLDNPTLLCTGDCNAALNTTVNGGTLGYSYSWSPGGETSPTIGNLCAGIYTTTVTDANLCVATASRNIASPAAITLVTSNTDNPCYGDCIATATVVATGGTGTFDYLWAGGYGTAAALSGLCMGNYSVSATDDNNCSASKGLTVSQAPSLTVTSSHTNVTCNADCDGTATASVSGGATPYNYSWSPGGATTSSMSNKCAATYTLQIDDNNGCAASDVIITITEPDPLSSVVTGTITSCIINNGTVTVSASGGTTPYQYLWSTGATTTVVTSVGPGTYSVTVTDANGCTFENATTISTVVTLTVNPSNSSLLCFGDCDASAFSNAAGGSPPYSYLWSTGSTAANIMSSLCAGDFSVTVTDSLGCSRGNSTTITAPAQLTLSPSSSSASCNGICDGSLFANDAGGTGTVSYFWWPGTETTAALTLQCAGDYTVRAQDANSCVATETITISQASSIVPNTTVVNASCGGSDGEIELNPSGGTAPYFYVWSPSGATTSTLSGLSVGLYSVSIVDIASCASDFIIPVQNDAGPTVATFSTSASCFGICDGTAMATVDTLGNDQSPYTFLFLPGGETATGPTVITFSVSGLCAGMHSVKVTDQLGCETIEAYNITQPPDILPGINVTAVSCNGNSDGQIVLQPSGGVGTPFDFLWAFGSQTTNSISGLPVGVYSVTITDASGCSINPPIPITEPPALSIAVSSTDVTCNGAANGTATAMVGGGTSPYSFAWSTTANTSAITGRGPGNYTVTVTDANLCVISQTVSITEPSILTSTKSSTNATCNSYCDGEAIMDVSGGTAPYSFLFSPGGQTAGGLTTFSLSAICAGIHNGVITDANGCTTLQSYTITTPAILSATVAVTNVMCNGFANGSATVTVAGGTTSYMYGWSTGANTSAVSGLSAGLYTFTVTDANLCSLTQTVTITQPVTALSVTIGSATITCNGTNNGTALATVGGGTLPYVYGWSTGANTSAVSGLSAGLYTFTVTDANLCSVTQTVSITEPTALTSAQSFTDEICNSACNGTITMDGSGGVLPYSFLFSPGGQTASGLTTFSLSAICVGIHNGTITDANGCTTLQSYTITTPPALSITITTTSINCNGFNTGSLNANTSGGTGMHSYLWSDGQTIQNISGLFAGGYTLTVTDANNCSFDGITTINEPAVIVPNVSTVNPLCINICNGSAASAPIGGLGSYSYSWSRSGETTASIGNLCAGDYTVAITDANACNVSQIITIADPQDISISSGIGPATCGKCDGTATVTASGGTGGYSYAWSPNVSTTNVASSLCAQLYTVTITDGNNCNAPFMIIVSNTGAPLLTVTTTSVTCNGSCDGTANVVASGGAGGYSYLWNDAGVQTTATATGLCAGNYFVQVTDAVSCVQFANENVVQPLPVKPNQNTTNATCIGVCNGSINITPTGGNGVYAYAWLPGGETSTMLNNICEGTYTVAITDGNNCVSDHAISISNSSSLIAIASATDVSCIGLCDGTANTTVISGTAPYIYSWNDPLSQADSLANNLCDGSYSVTITDNTGCQTSLTTMVGSPSPLSANASVTNATCGLCDGQIATSPSGGTAPYLFLWTNAQTASSLDNLCVGIYGLDITDDNGCTSNTSVIVNNDGGPTGVTPFIVDASCYGMCDGIAGITPIGGTAPYTYSWTHNADTANNQSNMCAGDYYVQVSDFNGCSYIASITIAQPSQIVDNRTVVNVSCGATICSGSISLDPSGATAPYTYGWSNSSAASNISNLCAGIYSVTITAANGCKQSYFIPINSSNGPDIAVTFTDPTCGSLSDGTATALASGGGGSPYSYLWVPGNQTSDSISGLSGGVYIVQATDATGCVSSALADLASPASISFSSPAETDQTCAEICNGTATVIPNGGILPYTYSWSGGSNAITATGLCAGSHTISVTDANNCVAQQIITIGSPALLDISLLATDASCNTTSDGSIITSISGGTVPYVYQWLPGGATSQNLNSVLPASYSVVATDNQGCSITDTATIFPVITVIANAGNDVSVCQSSVPVLLDASASVSAISYQWLVLPANTSISTGVTASVIPNSPGSLYYMVIAANGLCTDQDTIVITTHPLPVADAGVSVNIFTGQSISIGGSPTGPTGSLFSWTPLLGLNDSTLANPTTTLESNTTFTVLVTDQNSCASYDTVTIFVLPQIKAPSGITPNGDGANDEWQIDNIERFPNCLVEIYNRWGELLFSSNGYSERWDGTNKGKQLPIGTYYYLINLNDPLFPEAVTGPITIMR